MSPATGANASIAASAGAAADAPDTFHAGCSAAAHGIVRLRTALRSGAQLPHSLAERDGRVAKVSVATHLGRRRVGRGSALFEAARILDGLDLRGDALVV